MKKMMLGFTLVIFSIFVCGSFVYAKETNKIEQLYKVINKGAVPGLLTFVKKRSGESQAVLIKGNVRYSISTKKRDGGIVRIYFRPNNTLEQSLLSKMDFSVLTGRCISAVKSKNVKVPDDEYRPHDELFIYFEDRTNRNIFSYPQMTETEGLEFCDKHLSIVQNVYGL